MTTVNTDMRSLNTDNGDERSLTPSPPNSPLLGDSCGVAPLTPSPTLRSDGGSPHYQPFQVVIAIDFGTTASGYAYSLTHEPESIHMMRRWEGGDPGVANQKTPTCLLLTPAAQFHSFGFAARDCYHDLEPEEAKHWLYFDKFKMKIHSTSELTMDTELEAVNGKRLRALQVFSHALSYFRHHALMELADHAQEPLEAEAVRWVITVPAIWKQPAKQFMREAAYLVSDQYIVADCGGGTVDLTVHQIEESRGTLKELYKASGGPHGALGVDLAFEDLLGQIFGWDFIRCFKLKRPAAWVDLMIAFEARKRTASPNRPNALNISLPFSFIDFYRRHRSQSVEAAIRRSTCNAVQWSSQGMLRLSPEAINQLFQPTIKQVLQHIENLMRRPEVGGVRFLFLVGGFAESAMLQQAVQGMLGGKCRVIIPQDVGLTILKGAVLFGLDPGVVRVRRSPLTYGVGVLNTFVEGKHPQDKLLVKDGVRWCTDVFDSFVAADQSVAVGEVVHRSYTPARRGQSKILINIYCSAADSVAYVTEPGVRKCGTISLDLPQASPDQPPTGSSRHRREIRTSMQFGDTEIRVTGMDMTTARSVKVAIDFLSN
eukprot:gi/632979985/ref/XP_007906775.1/ PREDICTED: heat shock 70 kDa protein 12B-like [Callorhinchus milii]